MKPAPNHILWQEHQDCPGKASLICAGLPSCDHNGTIQDTQRSIRDHQINIKFHFIPKSQTVRTGAKRIIERKASRFDLIYTDTTVRTGETLAEIVNIPSIVSTIRRPSARSSTVSMESESLFSIPGFTIRRSTTISILCLIFLSDGLLRKAHTGFRQSATYASASLCLLRLCMVPPRPHTARQKLDLRSLRKDMMRCLPSGQLSAS